MQHILEARRGIEHHQFSNTRMNPDLVRVSLEKKRKSGKGGRVSG